MEQECVNFYQREGETCANFGNGLLSNNVGIQKKDVWKRQSFILALPAMNHICTRDPCQDWWRLHLRLCQVCLVVPPETGENRSSFVFVLMRTWLSLSCYNAPGSFWSIKVPYSCFNFAHTNSTDRLFLRFASLQQQEYTLNAILAL